MLEFAGERPQASHPNIGPEAEEMKTARRRGASRPRRAGIRIIGGQWRGRRLPVPSRAGLRPTTDRVRETLFNWLQDRITGARCLDLFAGTGALGLEALSRGAHSCTFVDSDPHAMAELRQRLQILDALDRSQCRQMPACRFLEQPLAPFDLVFLDPPFGDNLLAGSAAAFAHSGLRHEETLIYVETDDAEPASVLPADWSVHRIAVAGGVRYGLFRPGPFVGPG